MLVWEREKKSWHAQWTSANQISHETLILHQKAFTLTQFNPRSSNKS